MAEGMVNLIEAPMGGGKTCSVTAIVTDDYAGHLYGIEAPGMVAGHSQSGRSYEVAPSKMLLDPQGFIVHVKKEENRLIRIPSTYDTYSTTKIFANYHLYGMRYAYKNVFDVLKMIERDSHTGGKEAGNSKWLVDEGWLAAEARKGMNPLTIAVTEYSQLIRKEDIEMFVLTQHGRFIDWRMRFITKRKILTSYDNKTRMIRLLIQNLNKGTEKSLSFFAPTYWRYYNTDELPPMPTGLLEKARAHA